MGLLNTPAAPTARTMIVYGSNVTDALKPAWIKRFGELGMELELHPDFSFETIAGFLPVKLKITDTKIDELKGKTFKTGMELYCDEFNFRKDFPQPKQTFFNRNKPLPPVISQQIDAKMDQCDRVLTLNFTKDDSLELRMACMSAAVLCELIDGVCNNPQSRKWRTKENIAADLAEVVRVEEEMTMAWKLREFKGW